MRQPRLRRRWRQAGFWAYGVVSASTAHPYFSAFSIRLQCLLPLSAVGIVMQSALLCRLSDAKARCVTQSRPGPVLQVVAGSCYFDITFAAACVAYLPPLAGTPLRGLHLLCKIPYLVSVVLCQVSCSIRCTAVVVTLLAGGMVFGLSCTATSRALPAHCELGSRAGHALLEVSGGLVGVFPPRL